MISTRRFLSSVAKKDVAAAVRSLRDRAHKCLAAGERRQAAALLSDAIKEAQSSQIAHMKDTAIISAQCMINLAHLRNEAAPSLLESVPQTLASVHDDAAQDPELLARATETAAAAFEAARAHSTPTADGSDAWLPVKLPLLPPRDLAAAFEPLLHTLAAAHDAASVDALGILRLLAIAQEAQQDFGAAAATLDDVCERADRVVEWARPLVVAAEAEAAAEAALAAHHHHLAARIAAGVVRIRWARADAPRPADELAAAADEFRAARARAAAAGSEPALVTSSTRIGGALGAVANAWLTERLPAEEQQLLLTQEDDDR